MTAHSRDAGQQNRGNRRQQSDRERSETGTNRAKRAVAMILGGVLLVRGIRRRSLGGALAAVAGAWLLTRALGGRSRIERALRSRTGAGARDGYGSESAGATETAEATDAAETAEAADATGERDATAVSRSITVGRQADELYETWRDPETFSRIAGHFADVRSAGDDRSRWTVQAPFGREISWETRVVADEPGEFIRWQTPADATIPNEGSVSFRPAPGDRGTVVTLSMEFDPPGGALGAAALKRLDVVPESIAGQMLSRFKSLVESGEIPTLEGNSSARGKGDLL